MNLVSLIIRKTIQKITVIRIFFKFFESPVKID